MNLDEEEEVSGKGDRCLKYAEPKNKNEESVEADFQYLEIRGNQYRYLTFSPSLIFFSRFSTKR